MSSEKLLAVMREALGSQVEISSSRSLSGGCIHDSRKLVLSDGRTLVAKLAGADRWPWLLAEYEGLLSIEATQTIRTPRVISCYWSPNVACGVLLLEWIETKSPQGASLKRFAERLAALHRSTSSNGLFGFSQDNFLGATLQPNGWYADWPAFWKHQRWDFQLNLAARHPSPDVRELIRLGAQVSDHLPALLETSEPPSLIHGDLWSGNFLFDLAGEPVVIDPAPYYANREAEWGMILWMGGLPPSFLNVYQSIWPMPQGFERRCEIYKLYHLLNHLNLFGGSYLSASLAAMRRLARQLPR